jgi:hypothetical protein
VYAALLDARKKTDSDEGRQERSRMDSLSLVELKQLAKARRIKQYYILKRAQLIQLLDMPELPKSFIIEKMTIAQLRDEAKRKGVRGFWGLRREQLVGLLFPPDSGNLSDEMNKV